MEDTGKISKKVDEKSKNERTTEEDLDIKIGNEGVWKLETWRKERTGVGDKTGYNLRGSR